MLIVGAASMATATDEFIFAGGEKSIWIGRFDRESKTFQIVARSLGEGKWEWIDKDLPSVPLLAVAVADRLHLLAESNQHYFYRLGDKPKRLPWEKFPAAPMALCEGTPGFNGSSSPTLLSVSSVDAALGSTRPESGAAAIVASSRPARRVGLIVHQLVGYEWKPLGAPSPQVSLEAKGQVLLAVLDGVVYVLIQQADGPVKELLALRGEKWTRIDLPSEISLRRAITIAPLKGKLLMLLADVSPSTQPSRTASANVSVAEFDPQDGRITVRRVTLDGKPVDAWSRGQTPLATRFGDGIALLWRDGDDDKKLQFATCDATGRLSKPEAMVVFTQPPGNGEAQKIIDAFMWGVLLAVFVPMLALKPKSPPKPFTLPPGIRPGSLLRRLVAGLIDFVPFTLLGAAIFLPEVFEQQDIATFQNASDYMNSVGQSTSAAYMLIFSMLTYAAYGIFMELRFQATLGKMLLKLRVVADEGRRCGLREVSIRNLIRIMELLWLILIPLFILVMLMTRNRQRPGDILARSTVIDARSKPLPVPPDDEEHPEGDDDLT